MRGLKGACLRSDDGAVVVLVAILLAAGVLSGLLAIVADLGRVYAERRVVQNGADAASLALAQHCALRDADCLDNPHAVAAAQALADLNAPDAHTAVTQVCGTTPLAQCLGQTSEWTDCHAVGAEVTHYARVRTESQTPSGQRFLTPIFANLLGGATEMSVAACSQTAWGPAGSIVSSFPILLPICPGVPGGPPVVISRFDSSSPSREWTDCTVDGVAYPHVTAGFSWTRYDAQGQLCVDPVTVHVGDVLENYTSDPSACGSGQRTGETLQGIVDRGAALAVPVVGGHSSSGLGEYRFTVVSFKAFTILGYKVQGVGTYGQIPPGGWDSADYDCRAGSTSCLYGSFSDEVVPGGGGGDPDLGVKYIQLIP